MDRKPEFLTGQTIGQADNEAIEAVRVGIRTHVREKAGLPSDPNQLEVRVLSQLGKSTVVDATSTALSPITTRVIPIATFEHNPSGVGRRIVAYRNELRQHPLEKAA